MNENVIPLRSRQAVAKPSDPDRDAQRDERIHRARTEAIKELRGQISDLNKLLKYHVDGIGPVQIWSLGNLAGQIHGVLEEHAGGDCPQCKANESG